MNLARYSVLALAFNLAACGAQPPAAPVAAEKPANRPGKPGAPVDVQLSGPTQAAPGTVLSLSLHVIALSTLDQLELRLEPSAGLALLSGSTPQRWQDLAAGQTLRLPLQLQVLDGSAQELRVIALSGTGADQRGRVLLFPIGSGKRTPQPAEGKLSTTPEGERLLIQPAQEP